MQEVFEKIIEKFTSKIEALGGPSGDNEIQDTAVKEIMWCSEIVKQAAAEYNNGWIPCSEELPPPPKENPIFDSKPLELYLVSVKGTGYPFRAFWNGKIFTDGFSKVEPTAWQPLPEPYQPKGE